MTASITIPFYPGDNNVDPPALPQPDLKWLCVNVEGKRAITQIFLPTVPLESLANTEWKTWITTIQGPVMGRCDVTATQRQLLLDITLAYRAFTSGTAGVDDIWYTNFIRTLINIARSHKKQPIDTALTHLTSALRVLLPRAIFDAPDIPPVTHDPLPSIPVPMFSATGGSASASASTTGAESDSATVLRAPLPSLDEVYATVPRRSVDEGYDSDEDTMPSLRSVSDSSDEFDFDNSSDDEA